MLSLYICIFTSHKVNKDSVCVDSGFTLKQFLLLWGAPTIPKALLFLKSGTWSHIYIWITQFGPSTPFTPSSDQKESQ